MKTANVFNIQKFSIHDGPGIRTTVFLKGCNLRCKWCHNPESFTTTAELLIYDSRCIKCGRCVGACPNNAIYFDDSQKIKINREICTKCFSCIDSCYYSAREVVGKEVSEDFIITEVMKDKSFYDTSKGGVTFSGGEPLLQYEFLKSILPKFKEKNVHIAIETALNVNPSVIKTIAPLVDLFLCDLKIIEDDIHKVTTGVSNKQILDNFKLLSNLNVNLLVRIPIIPSVNDNEENLLGTLKFLSENTNFKDIELLKFHKLATSKYESLTYMYTAEMLDDLSDEIFANLKEKVIENGFNLI